MDATRMSDGQTVTLKRTVKSEHSEEVGIAKFFSSEPLASDPKDHCVPLLDVLEVPEYEGMVLLVMPILRPFNRPKKIWTFGEAVEFIRQVFEVRACISSVQTSANGVSCFRESNLCINIITLIG
jgi:hypothetical protein